MRGWSKGLVGLVGSGWLAAAGCAHAPETPAPRPVEAVADVIHACAAPDAATCPVLADQLRQLLARDVSPGSFLELLTAVRAGGTGALPAEVARAVRAVAWEPPIAGRFDEVARLDTQLAEHQKADLGWKLSTEGETTFAELTLRRNRALMGIVPICKNRLTDLAVALQAAQEPR